MGVVRRGGPCKRFLPRRPQRTSRQNRRGGVGKLLAALDPRGPHFFLGTESSLSCPPPTSGSLAGACGTRWNICEGEAKKKKKYPAFLPLLKKKKKKKKK